MTNIKDNINKASPSRIWHRLKGDCPFALLTAFKDQYEYPENARRNNALGCDIRIAKFGHCYIDGHWVVDQGTTQERHIKENFVFAVGTAGKEEHFFSFIIRQLKECDQECALIRTKDTIGIYNKDRKLDIKLDNFSPEMLIAAYSIIRGHGKNSTFVFENQRFPLGFFGTWIKRLKEKERLKTL